MKITIITKIILGLFVVGGVSFAGYTYLNTSIDSNIDSKIVDMQEKILDSFFALTNYKATGNTTLDISYETTGEYGMSVKSKIDLKDYTVNNNFFDSQLKGNLSGNIEGGAMGMTAKIDINTFFDIINKDGVYYFNLKDLGIKGFESNPLFSQANTMIETFKEKFKDGTYYSYKYKNESFDMKKLSYMNLKGKIQKSFIKVKEKKGDMYYLEPSIEFCNFIKYLSDEKDDCTKEEYDDIVKEYNKNIESYINYSIFGEKYFSINSKENKETSLKIYFSNTNIKKIIFDFKEDGFIGKVNFVYGKSIDINFGDEAKTMVFDFNGVLNGKDFKSGKLNISGKGVKSNIVFENGNIDGKTQIDLDGLVKTEINTTGKYTSKSYEIINKYNGDLEYLQTKLDGELSIKSDFSKSKVVSDVGFNLNHDNMKIKFNLHDESIKTEKSDEIKAPTNTKDIGELMN